MESINRALRLNPHRSSHTADKLRLPAASLPDWVEVGHVLCYVSRSNNSVTHHVKVQKIEERKQTVLVTFEMDKKVWKRVPFSEISRLGDGSLRPMWKPEPTVASCSRPEGPAAEAEDEVEVTGAVEGPSLPGPQNKDDEKASEEAGAEAASNQTSPAMKPAQSSATVDVDSEDERKEQMERRMRRMQNLNANKEQRSRSRSPKKKSLFYVPGHF
eukprot:TRINITY_DN9561_c0_g1_i2.p1 TRINITY_DN9561_c0_g1~~TRINITY_DN9561_c0_g1_i2.p1  ORF type:complete len:244 (-),score=56.66 TRINITY_DN9561_c0_g1_i2:155-799(-)